MTFRHKNNVYKRGKFQSTLRKWKQIVTLIYTRSWKHAIYFMSQVLFYVKATNNNKESGKFTSQSFERKFREIYNTLDAIIWDSAIAKCYTQ